MIDVSKLSVRKHLSNPSPVPQPCSLSKKDPMSLSQDQKAQQFLNQLQATAVMQPAYYGTDTLANYAFNDKSFLNDYSVGRGQSTSTTMHALVSYLGSSKHSEGDIASFLELVDGFGMANPYAPQGQLYTPSSWEQASHMFGSVAGEHMQLDVLFELSKNRKAAQASIAAAKDPQRVMGLPWSSTVRGSAVTAVNTMEVMGVIDLMYSVFLGTESTAPDLPSKNFHEQFTRDFYLKNRPKVVVHTNSNSLRSAIIMRLSNNLAGYVDAIHKAGDMIDAAMTQTGGNGKSIIWLTEAVEVLRNQCSAMLRATALPGYATTIFLPIGEHQEFHVFVDAGLDASDKIDSMINGLGNGDDEKIQLSKKDLLKLLADLEADEKANRSRNECLARTEAIFSGRTGVALMGATPAGFMAPALTTFNGMGQGGMGAGLHGYASASAVQMQQAALDMQRQAGMMQYGMPGNLLGVGMQFRQGVTDVMPIGEEPLNPGWVPSAAPEDTFKPAQDNAAS